MTAIAQHWEPVTCVMNAIVCCIVKEMELCEIEVLNCIRSGDYFKIILYIEFQLFRLVRCISFGGRVKRCR